MNTFPLDKALLLAIVLFGIGILGPLRRNNIIFLLMSVEIMLNAAGLVFVLAAQRWGQMDGQIMFIMILTVAAAEVAVGLALVLQFYHHFKSLDLGLASKLKGSIV